MVALTGIPRLLGTRGRPGGLPAPIIALCVVAAIAAPIIAPSNTWVRILIMALIYAVLASGLNIVVGYAGLLDLGYVAFYAVGAYFSSILIVRLAVETWGVPAANLWWLFFVNLIVAGLAASVVGVILGYPTLRVRGDYLAIMTLGFGEVIRIVATNFTPLTNGVAGIRDIPLPTLGPYVLEQPAQLYFLALALAAFALFLVRRVTRSYVGRAWTAIREDELVAQVLGIDPPRYKLVAYASGAFFAGMIGVYYAHLSQFVNPQSFDLSENILVLMLVILGGGGTLWGPAIAAIIWNVIAGWSLQTSVVQAHPEAREMALGLLVLGIVIFFPKGLLGTRQTILTSADLHAWSGPESEARLDQDNDARQGGASVVATAAAPGDPRVALACRGVGRSFGGLQALQNVSFRVYEREIVGIIGPNGAGKTTLFNLITGVVPCDSGEIELDGARISGLPGSRLARLGLARTFQNIRLLGDRTVLENVLVAAHARLDITVLDVILGRSRAQLWEASAVRRADRVLGFVGLADYRLSAAASLPYGLQRKVEIARALMSKPSVLLLDEPAAGMNDTETNELTDLIHRISDSGVTVVLIEHDMRLLMGISHRVVVLDHGQVIAEGTPAEIQRDPAVVEAYLGPAD